MLCYNWCTMLTNAGQRQFKANPVEFIEKIIKDYVAHSPNNLLSAFPGESIWEEPLVGFADGDDPLFQEFKTIIGDYHATPREALEMYLESGGLGQRDLSRISVISWVLPVAKKTRLSMRAENTVCSLRWNHTRWEGQDFIFRLSRYLVSMLESLGYFAVAPELSRWWETMKTPTGLSSRWSQRHIAYAAGLGTFSLNDGFITPEGMAIRAGSVVCNLELPASPRVYVDYRANCLFYRNGTCKKCIQRCPAQAISEQGHDKVKCQAYLLEMKELLKKLGRDAGYIGRTYYSCGFCQTGVPCEDRIPEG